MLGTINPVSVAWLYLLLQGSVSTTATAIVARSGGERCSQMHTHTHKTETSAGHHHHSGNNTRDGYHKGKLWAPACLGKMIWMARNNELWESACPALIFLPWHPLRRLSERRTDKKSHSIFLCLSPVPLQCLSFLSVRRAPTDQRGWAESWTTCWQDLLNSPQWHIVHGKEGGAQTPAHSYLPLIYWVNVFIHFFLFSV